MLGWDELPNPSYSPDLVPPDCYLLKSLLNLLGYKKLNNYEEKNALTSLFASKTQKFYEREIMMLSGRWEKVVDKNGQCSCA